MDAAVSQTWLTQLPESAWTAMLKYFNLSTALALRSAGRGMSDLVLAQAQNIEWVCEVRPFLGTNTTLQCVGFLSKHFPLLKHLGISLFSRSHSVPSPDDLAKHFAEMPKDELHALMQYVTGQQDVASLHALAAGATIPAENLSSLEEKTRFLTDTIEATFAKLAQGSTANSVDDGMLRGAVLVCDLKAREDLNGMEGHIIGFHAESGRYIVDLGPRQGSVRVKRCNLNAGDPSDVVKLVSALSCLTSLKFRTDVIFSEPTVLEHIGLLINLQALDITGKMCDAAVIKITSSCHLLKILKLLMQGSVGDAGLDSVGQCALLEDLTLGTFSSTDAVLARVVHRCSSLKKVDFFELAVGGETFHGIAANGVMEDIIMVECPNGTWDLALNDLLQACGSLVSIKLANNAGCVDFSQTAAHESVRRLHLENQSFVASTLRSLQSWRRLEKLNLYLYASPYVDHMLDCLVEAAASLMHLNEVILCGLQGDFPLGGPPTLILQLRNIWQPHEVKTDHYSTTFLLHEPTKEPCKLHTQEVPAVIEGIFHSESAAVVDEEVAKTQVDLQWADSVQQSIQSGFAESGTQSKDEHSLDAEGSSNMDACEEQVHILRFGCGDTEAFRQMLLKGSDLRLCRTALEDHGFSCTLPSGALIFVAPEHFGIVCQKLKGFDLHPFHIVIASRFECDLECALSTLSYKRRPREKVKDRHQVSMHSADVSTVTRDEDATDLWDGDVDSLYICEARTFLCLAKKPKNAEEVVQSTTEAVTESMLHYNYDRGTNPRRLV